MKRIFLPVLTLLLLSIASAQNPTEQFLHDLDEWTLIGRTATFNSYCKPKAIRTMPNGIVRVWIKDVLNTVENSVSERRTFMEFDCEQRTVQMLEIVTYNSHGGVVKSINPLNDFGRSLPAETVVPDSVGDQMLTFVCEHR